MTLNPIVTGLSPEEHIKRLELALESSNLGIWDWDLRTQSVHFDKRWCSMLGLEHESTPMHLSTWQDRVHPDDLEACFADINAYLQGKTPIYENIHRMRHANGEWIYILDRGLLSGWDAEGQPIRFTGTHRDVTASEKARLLLENQSRIFAKMIRFLPLAVVMLDTQLNFLVASQHWLKEHQRTEPELKSAAFPSFFPDTGRDWNSVAQQVLAGATLSQDREWAKRTDGTPAWYRWACLPWTLEEGSVGGLIFVCEDISEMVAVQERLTSESRLSAIGQMAGSLAHEINNPLAIIRANAEVLLMQEAQKKLTPERLEKATRSIIKTTQRIERIVKALRTISHGSMQTKLQLTLLDEAILETAELCTDRFRHQGILLDLDLALLHQRPGRIDLAQFSQIILNLLNNAHDAVQNLPDKWVKVSAELSSDHMQIIVQDSGHGIPQDIRDKIMTPFFTTKEVGAGTGLGLSLSQTYAKNHGGTLRYQEREGHTSFVLTLPLSLFEAS